ncbi:restriction endonuclease subunit S, partial [Enterobacter hormaechei]|uniref:restriction endonuclease subunit S n=2 Tax=Enterobacterales TaxID=91347 RepID=UPI000F224438
MSELSYLEKLLDGAEVEWLPLGVLGELVRGNGLPKTDFTEAGIPAIHYGQIYTFYGLSTETTKSFVSQDTAKKLKKVNTGDVVITNTSENLDDVGKALVYLGKEQAVTGGHATIFKPREGIIGKYFAYFTQTNSFYNEKRKYSKGTKVIDVSASDMAKIIIPIPCPNNPEKSLAIQLEIVRILDKFTALTAELTAELNMRKKQYNYYRDQLLSFDEDEVEWKMLGDLGENLDSKRKPITSGLREAGSIPYYG